MRWAIEFSDRALKDAKLLRRAKLWKKGALILDILREDPFQTPPHFEKLSRELKGSYSRRINKKHRVVYDVDKARRAVFVIRMWSHYEKK